MQIRRLRKTRQTKPQVQCANNEAHCGSSLGWPPPATMDCKNAVPDCDNKSHEVVDMAMRIVAGGVADAMTATCVTSHASHCRNKRSRRDATIGTQPSERNQRNAVIGHHMLIHMHGVSVLVFLFGPAPLVTRQQHVGQPHPSQFPWGCSGLWGWHECPPPLLWLLRLLLQHLWREASGRRFRSHLLLPLLLLLHLQLKLRHLWRHSGWRFDRQAPFRKQTCAIASVRECGHRRTRHGNSAIGARPSERNRRTIHMGTGCANCSGMVALR